MPEQFEDGYVKSYRKTTRNPIWTVCSPAAFKVFWGCVLAANWRDSDWYDGVETVHIPRGAFVTSIRKLASYCNVSFQQARDGLDHMEKLGIAKVTGQPRTHRGTHRGTHGWTLVTILNYDTYNSVTEDPEHATEQQVDHLNLSDLGSPKNNNRRSKEVKKNTTPNPLHDLVDPFVQTIHARHPAVRRCSPGEVRDKLAAIIRTVPVSERLATLERIDSVHKGWCETESWTKDGGQFSKGLDNWLAPTKRRWDQEAPAPTAGGLVQTSGNSLTTAERNRIIRNTLFEQDTMEALSEQVQPSRSRANDPSFRDAAIFPD